MRHEGLWVSWWIASSICDLANITLQLLLPLGKSCRNSWNRGVWASESFSTLWKTRNLMPLPGIETRFLGRPVVIQVTIPTDITRIFFTAVNWLNQTETNRNMTQQEGNQYWSIKWQLLSGPTLLDHEMKAVRFFKTLVVICQSTRREILGDQNLYSTFYSSLLAIQLFVSFDLLSNSLSCLCIHSHLTPILNLRFSQMLSNIILPS
jgi:hypothetical protein